MAITYKLDVALHQKRLMAIREQRWERWHQLHDHDGRAAFWLATIPALVLFWIVMGYVVDKFF